MAAILIKDLPDSVELDKQAMSAIVGGARSSAHRCFARMQRRRTARGSSIFRLARLALPRLNPRPKPQVGKRANRLVWHTRALNPGKPQAGRSRFARRLLAGTAKPTHIADGIPLEEIGFGRLGGRSIESWKQGIFAR